MELYYSQVNLHEETLTILFFVTQNLQYVLTYYFAKS